MAQYTVEYGTIWVKDVAYKEGAIIDLEEDNAIRIGPQVKKVEGTVLVVPSSPPADDPPAEHKAGNSKKSVQEEA